MWHSYVVRWDMQMYVHALPQQAIRNKNSKNPKMQNVGVSIFPFILRERNMKRLTNEFENLS